MKDQEGRSFINHDYPIYLYQSLDEERKVIHQPEMNYIMTAFRKDLARESLSVSSGLLDQGPWCSMGSLRAKELANAFLKRVEPSALVSILTWNIDVNQMDSMQKHLWGIYPLNILARVALARALENNDQKGDSGDSHDNGGNKSKDKDALLRDIIRPLMEYGLITQPIDFDCDQQKDQSQKMQNHGANHFDITLSTLDNACGYRLEEYVVSYMTLYLVSRLGGAVKFARFFKDTPISSTGDKDTLAQNALESWQRFIKSSAADLETDMKKAFEWISEQDIQEASQLFFSWMDK